MVNDKTSPSQMANFIWSVADILRGDFRQSQYGRIILPLTLLRRLECVLASTKDAVLEAAKQTQDRPDPLREQLLKEKSGQAFFNTSPFTLGSLSDNQTAQDLMSYVNAFSADAREIFEYFNFDDYVQLLNNANLLYQVVEKFAAMDLSPASISNYGMGLVFEELIRKFAESSNDTAGDHFTPRDMVHLTTSLVLAGQEQRLTPYSIITIYDPAVGTGGFLTEGEQYIKQVSEKVHVNLFGQEINGESYAICKAEMLIKGKIVSNIKYGDTLANDQLATEKFNIMLANPPFGVNWSKSRKEVEEEHKLKGFDGRFGPGLPRVSDGALLFLLHLVSKMHDPAQDGSRIGIILNGSPLFTGGAGSGESEIRRYLLERDLVEAIVAVPNDMFYNTGIATYIWVLTNNKTPERKGKIQLIDASDKYTRMRKSLGSKRNYISDEDQDEIVRLYGHRVEDKKSKFFYNHEFGYRRITIERPLRLSAQFNAERVETLRFATGPLHEPMKALYEQFGKEWDGSNYGCFDEEKLPEINAMLRADFESLRTTQIKNLLSADLWLKQKELMETAQALKEEIGAEQYNDFNAFNKLFDKALKAIGERLAAREKKQIIDAITWTNPEAEPVIKRVHKGEANPLYGAVQYQGKVVEFEADTDLRDYENIPLDPSLSTIELVESYFKREVQPHVSDAWIDASKKDERDGELGIVGYEIPFNRHFYEFVPPRPLEEIDAELKECTDRIKKMIEGLSV